MSNSFINRSRNEELKRYARTSLVLSLVGIFTWVLLFIPQILSIIFGVKSLESEDRNQGITGIAISGATIILGLILIVSFVPFYMISANKLAVDQDVSTIELVEMVEEELDMAAGEEIDLGDEMIPEAAMPEDLSVRSFTAKGLSMDIGYPLGWRVLDTDMLKQVEEKMATGADTKASLHGRPLIRTGAVQVPVPSGEYAGSLIVKVEDFAEIEPGLTPELYFNEMKAGMSDVFGHVIYSDVSSYEIDGRAFSKISMSYNVGEHAIEQRIFCSVENDIAVTVVCAYEDYMQMEILTKSVDSLRLK